MILKTVLVMFLVIVGVCSEEDYLDPVIDMLLNGVSEEMVNPEIDNVDDEAGGVWKCGNCTDLGTARLVHSETNLVDTGLDEQDMADVQISLVVTRMRCVTVNAEQPAAVRKVVGSCDGSSVTLSVSSTHNFTILVYT